MDNVKKVLGSHKVGTTTTAVLECGHQVPYSEVKWPEQVAECTKRHDEPAPPQDQHSAS